MNIRPRRNRKNAAIRDMVQESHLGVENLIFPLFLKDGKNIKEEIHSLPNIYRWSIDLLLKEIEECLKLGIRVFDIFPAVEEHLKNETA
jgi:porphobilinogen synthase